MNPQQQPPSNYVSGNKFFIMHGFNKELREGILIQLSNKIDELSQLKNPAPIDIYINSRGGDGFLCLTLIQLMELAKSRGIKVRTIVTQAAFSAGSLVAIAGTPGERYISRTAEHCVHYGTQYGWEETTPLQIERNTDYKKRWFKNLKSTYEKYASIPNLDEQLKDDSFFIPAAQAIKWGLADKFMEELS